MLAGYHGGFAGMSNWEDMGMREELSTTASPDTGAPIQSDEHTLDLTSVVWSSHAKKTYLN